MQHMSEHQFNKQEAWRISSRSAQGGCVEVSRGTTTTSVRHSKHPEDAVLNFNDREWRAFIEGVKLGEFD